MTYKILYVDYDGKRHFLKQAGFVETAEEATPYKTKTEAKENILRWSSRGLDGKLTLKCFEGGEFFIFSFYHKVRWDAPE